MGVIKAIRFGKGIAYPVFLFLVSVSLTVPAQEVAPAEGDTLSENGRTYVFYKVAKGQTLYSLSKTHAIEIDRILEANPEVKAAGLKEGNLIRIPIGTLPPKNTEASENVQPEIREKPAGFAWHKVKRGETLYSLSKAMDLTIDELTQANPELQKGGLKTGMELRIPVKDEPADTLPADPGMPIADSAWSEPGHYSVALFLPLFLDLADSLETRNRRYDENNRSDDKRIPEESGMGLEFYEGVLMAIDSLRNLTSRIVLKVYDTANDTDLVKKHIREGALDSINLVLGPLYPRPLDILLPAAKKRQVDLIVPFAQEEALPESNTHMCKVTAPASAHVHALAVQAARRFAGAHIQLVYTDRPSYRALRDTFVHTFYRHIPAYKDSASVRFKDINYSKMKMEGVRAALSPTDTNVVVFLNTEYSLVTDFVSKLNYTAIKEKSQPIVLFGMHNWKNFDNIDVAYLHNLFVHIPSSHYVNYQDSTVLRFIRRFREKFSTDPSNYAFMGFDLAMYAFTTLHRQGGHICRNIPAQSWQGLQTGLCFRSDPGKVAENQFSRIYVIHDFGLQPAETFRFPPPAEEE